MKVCYKKQGDYMLPNLKLKQRKNIKLGRYARMRLKYIKKEMKAFYMTLLSTDELTEYLFKIEAEAIEMEFRLIESMKKSQNVDEKLKEKDQMKWIQMMNNIANSAQEMVLNKVIYSCRQ